MKFENTAVFNFEGALRGMRLPLQSGSKADSHYCIPNQCVQCKYGGFKEPTDNPYSWQPCTGEDIDWQPYCIGENDMNLAQRLVGAQEPHSKFLRQILVSTDVTASLALFKQFDQYKVGTVTDSESTMHTLSKNPITMDMFDQTNYEPYLEVYDGEPYRSDNLIEDLWANLICDLETLRQKYNETKDKRYWQELVRMLPESFLQKRHWTANYAVVRNIYMQRCKTPHKLGEWKAFGNWVRSLPYSSYLLTYEKPKDDSAQDNKEQNI